MPRTDYEAKFHYALKRIASYMTPAQLRREDYGLSEEESLEMAYENVINEAKFALRGYRKPRAGTVQPQEPAKATSAASAPASTFSSSR